MDNNKKTVSRKTGNAGEEYACGYLIKNGYTVLKRNFKARHGEIDIIVKDKTYIAFTEVKLRKILAQKPAFSVDEKKISHIKSATEEFLYKNKENSEIQNLVVRYDVIEILTQDGKIVSLNHIKGAFD